ncbi:MAG: ABC transporter permease subunit [Bacilli bacterium]
MIYFIIFQLIPIFNMKLAFYDYRIVGNNVFVGLKHFKTLFSSPQFYNILLNTLIISSLKILFVFPVSIILALLLNELNNSKFKKWIQNIIYLPHFISWVVVATIWISFLNYQNGSINEILSFFNLERIDFINSKIYIRFILILSEVWKSSGWDTIIYLVALLRIDSSIYDAATMDQANTWQKIRYITLPLITPTIITVFILNLGFIMSAGFDQVLNFSNDSTLSKIDIIDTYVYRIGILNSQYSIASAAGLFKAFIGACLIIMTHFLAKKLSGKGIW